MSSKSLPNLVSTKAILSLALLAFTISNTVKAQSFYSSNPGPASFATNWNTSSRSNPNEPTVVRQRTTATYPANASVAFVTQGPAVTPAMSGISQPTVPGNRAIVRRGVAYAPANAPLCVKKAIWATNTIRTKPYVWGGGHESFYDSRGYDCSGTVSFALHFAGQLSSPTDSHSLMSFGEPGRGRWMTIYAGNGHTWMEIAGIRLDTTGNGNEGPRWRVDGRNPWGYTARHPAGL